MKPIITIATMPKIILPVICFLFIINACAGLKLSKSVEPIISDFLNQHYPSAKEKAEKILSIEPDNIDALFMYLNVFQIELVDYESYVMDGHSFLQTADSVITLFKKLSQSVSKEEMTKNIFYQGTIYGMKSLVLAKQGDWVQGVKYARTSVKLLKQAMEIDSTLYEAYYGIGLYNYYLGNYFKWVPFMAGRYRRGLDEIEKVAYSSSPLSYMAGNSIAWIYVDLQEYNKADDAVASILEKYPDNTIFLRIKARIELLKKNYKSAVTIGKKMVELSGQRNPVNWSDLIDAYQIVVASFDAMGKREECLKVIHTVISLEVPVAAKKNEYVGKHLDYIISTKKKYEQ